MSLLSSEEVKLNGGQRALNWEIVWGQNTNNYNNNEIWTDV